MQYFTIEISGKPVISFRSADRESAEQLFEAEDFREDITFLQWDEKPLWDGEEPIELRNANEEEQKEVEEAYDFDDDPEKSPDDELVVFLVDVVDPDEDYEEEEEA